MTKEQIDKLARFYRELLVKRGRYARQESLSGGALMVEVEIETFMEILTCLGCRTAVLNRSAELSMLKEE